jgi:quercetin dioxygenase-like cupin family protein
MYFHDPETRSSKQIAPGIQSRTFWGEKLMLAVVELEANAVLPAHRHPHEQSSYVLEGELEFEVGGQSRKLKPGEIVTIPGDVEHIVRVGPRPAKVLDIFTPIREDLKY